MAKNGTTSNGTTQNGNSQSKSPKSTVCPRCKTNQKAITKSGRVSGLCASCNNQASKLSKSKNHPSKSTQQLVLVNEIAQITDSLPKLAGSKKSQLQTKIAELLALLNGQS